MFWFPVLRRSCVGVLVITVVFRGPGYLASVSLSSKDVSLSPSLSSLRFFKSQKTCLNALTLISYLGVPTFTTLTASAAPMAATRHGGCHVFRLCDVAHAPCFWLLHCISLWFLCYWPPEPPLTGFQMGSACFVWTLLLFFSAKLSCFNVLSRTLAHDIAFSS